MLTLLPEPLVLHSAAFAGANGRHMGVVYPQLRAVPGRDRGRYRTSVSFLGILSDDGPHGRFAAGGAKDPQLHLRGAPDALDAVGAERFVLRVLGFHCEECVGGQHPDGPHADEVQYFADDALQGQPGRFRHLLLIRIFATIGFTSALRRSPRIF